MVLNWVVTSGTAEEPLAFDISVDVRLPVGCYRTSTRDCGAPFPIWTAVLQNVPGVNPHPIWPLSYVWRRESTFEGKTSSYEAVQIVDQFGNQLPAFQNFVNVASPFNPFFTKVLKTVQPPQQCGSRPFWCFTSIPFVCG